MTAPAGHFRSRVPCLAGRNLLLALALLCASALLPAQSSGYWHTEGSRIADDSGATVRIAGITWFGFETSEEVAHGLWYQDYRHIVHTVKQQGFNTLRIPFSNQMVEHPIIPFTEHRKGGINQNLVGLTSLQILDQVIAAAGAEGLKVILDNHRSNSGNSNQAGGLWYTPDYPESAWIADWRSLVERYRHFTDEAGNPIVVGVDLRNEPYRMVGGLPTGSCWTGDMASGGCSIADTAHNWPAAAERAGAAIQSLNPNLLIFVEGVDCYSGDCDWQGGNLQGAGAYPVVLPYSNHLVYSAHDYGPDISQQKWFNPQTTPATLEALWTKNWAYLSMQDIAPVWLGEFGTSNDPEAISASVPGSQGQWFSSLIGFLRAQPQIGWSYWALNGEDRSGLLAYNYDLIPPSGQKAAALQSLQFPLASVQAPEPAMVSAVAPGSIRTAAQPPPPSPSAILRLRAAAALAASMVAVVVVQNRRTARDSARKRRTGSKETRHSSAA